MKRNEIITTIVEYLNDNMEIFTEIIEQLDNWNGYLSDSRYYPMEELDEIFINEDATYILQRAFFGSDDEYPEDGFNPNKNYFRFNGYGNLVSTDYIDYSDFLDTYFVEEIIENRNHLDITDDELNNLLDMLEDVEEDKTA